ncbi:MAG: helix-turn-helix domain-containing protein [Lachnospiraceae bacterium]|jgi:transcriptional regulator with XRE-family HTH domain|nr:helix-turn-helix domain-containing protein [Lachnospiraceae bacterium]
MKDGFPSEIQMTDSDYKRFFEFGIYVRNKRLASGIGLRTMAHIMGISPSYICDIEQGRRYPPNNKLDELANVLHLQGDDLSTYFDKAALARGETVPYDLCCYIKEKAQVRAALRAAKSGELSGEDWEEVLALIRSKIKAG